MTNGTFGRLLSAAALLVGMAGGATASLLAGFAAMVWFNEFITI